VVAAQKEGRKSGPAGVEGEAGRGWAESGIGPEFKRNYFRISIDFSIWQNFENCTRRFRRNFDMRIFPKIF
jgi:hypothetical protein